MKRLTGRSGDYFSLVRFSHTIFALPFAVAGYFIAVTEPGYSFSLRTFMLVLACMVFARSAAMAFNRWADVHFDLLNPRTAVREIPAGRISKRQALTFVIITSLLFVATTALINRLTLILSPVALAVILGYSYTKRFTPLCHLVLGLGLGLAPIGAYIAVTGVFALLPLIYSFIVLTWVSGFDIIYSLQDDQFDRNTGLFSIPAVMSRSRALAVSATLHLVSLALVIAAGVTGKGGWIFWTGAAIFAFMLMYQHLIVRPGDLSRVNTAFGTTNGHASVIFGLAVMLDRLLL